MISVIIKVILTRDREILYEKKNRLATIYQAYCTRTHSQRTRNTTRISSALSFSLLSSPSLSLSRFMFLHLLFCDGHRSHVCVSFTYGLRYARHTRIMRHPITHSLGASGSANDDDDLLISSVVLSPQEISCK